ncbi:hypothetical protein [Dethiothermospora halolimnae]|uniref:hypothetical protein n=1 Tax=Dethiothermospora halolimnae TaxID=3114390 RepID=UPI003CCBF35D
MNKKKRVVVLFLAVVTMLMVVGNVAFASHSYVIDEGCYKVDKYTEKCCKTYVTCPDYDESNCTERRRCNTITYPVE